MHGFCGSEQYLLSKLDVFYTLYFYLLCFANVILSLDVVLGFSERWWQLRLLRLILQTCGSGFQGILHVDELKWTKKHLWTLTDLKYGCIELGSFYDFYLWITWVTWVISPINSMFSCLWDSNNSYFRYFETHREKAEQAMLCIFWKTLSWLKEHLCMFIGSDKLLC